MAVFIEKSIDSCTGRFHARHKKNIQPLAHVEVRYIPFSSSLQPHLARSFHD
jgi:hypothetical protein